MNTTSRFRVAYARHREAEGRGAGGLAELRELPFLRRGPRAREWGVRARTFERLVESVLAPRAREIFPRPARVLDLGAGNGWLCYRLALQGHATIALDWRRDDVDGLGAAAGYRQALPTLFPRVGASFQVLPFRDACFDIVVFNASVHYAEDLRQALAEARRVTLPGGRLAIADSPFYHSAIDGELMVAEKRSAMRRGLGAAAEDLLALRSIEFLTRERLADASFGLGLTWRRRRVRYPLWYELRPLVARLTGARPPSRFDVWEARVGEGAA